MQAARYIEHNPVRARLASRPEPYRWSSAAAHLAVCDDGLVSVEPMLEMVGEGRWRGFLGEAISRDGGELFRRQEPPARRSGYGGEGAETGRPLGEEGFVGRLEAAVGRALGLKKYGPMGPWKHRHQS